MSTLSMEDIQNLVSSAQGRCVSIYLPTIEKGQETRQNIIRYKNLVDKAQDVLRSLDMENPEIKEFFSQAETLMNDAPFWQHQEKGLAFFIAEDFFQTFRL